MGALGLNVGGPPWGLPDKHFAKGKEVCEIVVVEKPWKKKEIGYLKFHPAATHFNLNVGFKNWKFSERARNT